MSTPLTENEEAVKNAIGYEPVLVSLAPGVGGKTHRTAVDRNTLVSTIAPLLDIKDKELADLRANIIGTRLTLESVVTANKLAIERMERGGALHDAIQWRKAENTAFAYAISQLNRLIEQ